MTAGKTASGPNPSDSGGSQEVSSAASGGKSAGTTQTMSVHAHDETDTGESLEFNAETRAAGKTEAADSIGSGSKSLSPEVRNLIADVGPGAVVFESADGPRSFPRPNPQAIEERMLGVLAQVLEQG